ncbi:single-stranded DNA-binding protein [Alkalilimnicola ehrlichii]|uniref:Single-stranded DNA-binding protein n=1 Tax=Alkalilimnicola ehrlichii TaxID=351052 RepID=A0A3E0X0P5_9GAMM|nr:uracil-DNA glycosylase family protein [Alkalilimnicola ehrlichii]RFA30420.1 single-stranded DNA-binding protein [Alkalilimnicola ehrlichii]RFA37973.1 single-stranded DNA-binding protein [Alkalilimnicola ehrlichii]
MSASAETLIQITRELGRECDALEFGPPTTHVYNPLDYAWVPHEQYLRLFHGGRPEVVLVGMNPGPFGMLQTGVPFGDIVMVRDWLGIEAPVEQPPHVHPKRPVSGFANRRREVSGSRIWGWAQERFGTAERFLERFFVLNYCPLAFFDEKGTNRTPDKLRRDEQRALFEVCDRGLGRLLDALQPRWVVGVGRFAEQRVEAVAESRGMQVTGVTHPSPANPKANQGWAKHMDALLEELGVAA